MSKPSAKEQQQQILAVKYWNIQNSFLEVSVGRSGWGSVFQEAGIHLINFFDVNLFYHEINKFLNLNLSY